MRAVYILYTIKYIHVTALVVPSDKARLSAAGSSTKVGMYIWVAMGRGESRGCKKNDPQSIENN